MKNKRTQKLIECAIFIALATVLSLVKIIPMPFGGSVTLLSMLPIIIISYRHGLKWGIPSALIYSVIQGLLDVSVISGAFMPGDAQMVWYNAILMCLLDYIVAFAVLGFGGLFRKRANPSEALCLGAITAVLLRYVTHILSGAILWSTWAEWFFTDVIGGETGAYVLSHFSGAGLSIIYSIVYNGIYMIPEIIFTGIAAYLVGKIPYIAKKSDIKEA